MPKGKKNLYSCQVCGEFIITLDIDDGTTPMFLSCHVTPGCAGTMASNFYRCEQRLPHQYEFFKPANLDGYDEAMQDHLRKGGLAFRRREVRLDVIRDEILREAISYVRGRDFISASQLQRRFRISYPVAAQLLDGLRFHGVIHLQKNKTGSIYVVKAERK